MSLPRTARAAAFLGAATLALSAHAAAGAVLPADTTAILSGAPSLLDAFPAPVGVAGTRSWTVSQDGRYVAFAATSDGLVDGDDDRVYNVYVKDIATGAVTLASRRSGGAGEPGHSDCSDPAISDDGARVAFTCDGPLDANDTNAVSDVYVRDLPSATTMLVSRAGGLGAVGDRQSRGPRLSQTGEYVAFASDATNLDPDSTSGQKIFRRQIGGGNPTIVISRRSSAAGNEPVDAGDESSISDDGNRIAFTNPGLGALDPADTNGVSDVYIRDVAAGTTVLASRAPGAGAAGNGPSRAPAIAGDGSAVAFESTANSFDFDEDPDKEPDIYWRSLAGTANTQNTALVSINAAGKKGVRSTAPSSDDSGWVIGFLSQATELDPADPDPSTDAYVKNVQTNVLQIASRADGTSGAVANANANAVAVSGDGSKVAAGLVHGITPDVDPRLSNVILRDLSADPQRTVSVARPAGLTAFENTGGFSGVAALSADGRYAAFHSRAPGLGLPDGAVSGIFVRDRVTGDITLASRADGPAGAPFTGSIGTPAISADGQRVAFSAALTQGPAEVWVRDLPSGRTFLASRADGADGAAGDAASNAPALDADGSRVAFASGATNLGDGDTDSLSDVHVRDLGAGQTILVSRGDGAVGAKGDAPSFGADINADGTRVAFLSEAKNLGDGDTDAVRDVHLRDLSAGTTRVVSATPSGVKGDAAAWRASIDDAGTRIAFDSSATNLLGATLPVSKVFVRDLAAGNLVVASRADGADGALSDAESWGGTISPDGRYVAFASEAGNLAGGSAGPTLVYRRDLLAGATALASRRQGPDGAPVQQDAQPGDITEAGGCVSFGTRDALFGAPSDYGQAYVRTFRADCAASDPDGTPGGNGDGGSTSGAADTVAPVLRNVRLSRVHIRVARASTALSAAVRRGTVLRFTSSEAGTLSIVVARATRARKGRPAYRRAGTLTRRMAAGRGSVRLSGRLGRRALRPGRYRLRVTARDAAGNRSKAARLRLTVVRG